MEFNVGSVGQRGVVRKVVGSSTRLLRYSAPQVGDHDFSSLPHIPTPSSRRASASLNPPLMGPERGRSWPHLRSPYLAHPHPLRRSQRIWSSVGELLEVALWMLSPVCMYVWESVTDRQSAFGGQLCQLLQEDFARALPLGSCHSSPCAPRATCAATSAHFPSSCTISTSQKLRMHYDGVEGGAGQNARQGTRTDNHRKLCCSSGILLREACRTPANTVAARRLMAVMLDQCANHLFFSFLLFS